MRCISPSDNGSSSNRRFDSNCTAFLRLVSIQVYWTTLAGSEIENIGAATLRVSFKDKSANVKFNIIEAPGSPSMLGCRQSQDLGIISTNLVEVNTIPPNTAAAEAQLGQLSKSTILKEYHDWFDKLGCFPGEKYNIQLIDEPVQVIHPPRTVPVHILPLHKEKLDKMIADDVITAVHEPTD